MMKRHVLCVMAVCLGLTAATAWGQASPADAVAQAVAESGVFPAGTTVVSVTVDGVSAVIDLSAEAAVGLTDSQSDDMVKAIVDALEASPEITDVEVTAAGQPLWQYLPPATGGGTLAAPSAPEAPMMMMAMAAPMAGPTSSELAGKLAVLHPSHGSYASTTSWYRAMRTFCGPNPAPPRPAGWAGSTYQPSNYYFWDMGYQWDSFYEDDMSPETIRFLEAYLKSSGAEVWVSRNLDKDAGDFDAVGYGYPAAPFQLPKWQTAAKYYLQDRGDIPEWVWNTTDVTGESNKDLRARAYYANYRMEQGGYAWEDCVSFSLHSNAAVRVPRVGQRPSGTPPCIPYLTTQPRHTAPPSRPRSSTRSRPSMTASGPRPCTRREPPDRNGRPAHTVATIRTASPPGTTGSGWQDRGVKTSNFGEIRECKMPAQLMELAFHDDWKFYPDHVFMMDQIWRSTVAWGMYEGMCQYFGVPAKARLAAAAVYADFPTTVILPGEAFTATVTVQNLGQAWCWGNKFDAATKVYGPYTVWKLAAVGAANPFDGTKVEIDAADVIMPGDTKTFTLQLTAPATCGIYDG